MKKTILLSSMLLANFAIAEQFAKNPNAENTESVQTNYFLQGGGSPPVTQNTDTAAIITPLSVACPSDDDSYYRRFDLDGAHGISETLNVSSVDIGIENAVGANSGLQPVVVNLYSILNADAFTLANMNLIGTVTTDVADADALTVKNFSVAGTVDGSTHDLVVELFAEDTTGGHTFFIGSNSAGQSGPTFLRSPGCGADEPTDVATLGDFGSMHQIMVVNGTLEQVPVELMNFSIE